MEYTDDPSPNDRHLREWSLLLQDHPDADRALRAARRLHLEQLAEILSHLVDGG